MLDEDVIEKLIKPLIDSQRRLNLYVLKKIAQVIKEIGELTPSQARQLERLFKTGNNVQEINAFLAKETGLQINQIKKIIKSAAKLSYLQLEPYYNYRKLPFIPFEENEEMQQVVEAISKQTVKEFTNISNARAFMIRDLSNPTRLIPTPIAKTYQSVVDEAVIATQNGLMDYQTAMRKTMKQLVDSGIRRVSYSPESGRRYTQRLDTAVRRNILDGALAVSQQIQDIGGKQFNADGKELSVHSMSAPDHEPIQGHQFSNEEFDKLQNDMPFQDYRGNKFESIKRAIGQYNCMHFAFSIVLGVTNPTYSQKQLNDLINQNQKGYTLPNGKHLTKYECTQEQRRMETQIRYAKEGQIVAKTAGDMKLATDYQIKINDLLKQYTEFSKACKINPQYDRTYIDGYRQLKATEYVYE